MVASAAEGGDCYRKRLAVRLQTSESIELAETVVVVFGSCEFINR